MAQGPHSKAAIFSRELILTVWSRDGHEHHHKPKFVTNQNGLWCVNQRFMSILIIRLQIMNDIPKALGKMLSSLVFLITILCTFTFLFYQLGRVCMQRHKSRTKSYPCNLPRGSQKTVFPKCFAHSIVVVYLSLSFDPLLGMSETKSFKSYHKYLAHASSHTAALGCLQGKTLNCLGNGKCIGHHDFEDVPTVAACWLPTVNHECHGAHRSQKQHIKSKYCLALNCDKIINMRIWVACLERAEQIQVSRM